MSGGDFGLFPSAHWAGLADASAGTICIYCGGRVRKGEPVAQGMDDSVLKTWHQDCRREPGWEVGAFPMVEA